MSLHITYIYIISLSTQRCYHCPHLINYICWSDQGICFDHYHMSSAMLAWLISDLNWDHYMYVFCFCRGCISSSQVPATLGSMLRTRNMARGCSNILMDPSMKVSQFTMDTVISILVNGKTELLNKIYKGSFSLLRGVGRWCELALYLFQDLPTVQFLIDAWI